MIGDEVIANPELRSRIIQFPEKIVVLVRLAFPVFLGKSPDLIIERPMDHRTKVKSGHWGGWRTPHALGGRHQLGVTEPPTAPVPQAPTRGRYITLRPHLCEDFAHSAKNREPMDNFRIREHQNLSTRCSHAKIIRHARIKCAVFPWQVDNLDRPRKWAMGFRGFRRTVIHHNDLDVIRRIKVAVRIKVTLKRVLAIPVRHDD